MSPCLPTDGPCALLRMRRWREGWDDYESRFHVDGEPAKINLDLAIPRWQGEPLAGKHLLVIYEQGIGDEVQFASCYPDVITRAEHCTITCSPRLLPIFQRSFSKATFLPVAAEARETWRPENEQQWDCFAPAGSLPRFLRNDDRDFPGHPYLIASQLSRNPRQDSSARMRVGVSWRGGALPDQIRQRSVPFDLFQRLFDVAGVEFVNLQHGRADEATRKELSRCGVLRSNEIDPFQELEPWFDLISSLDLVISVDNSNVHFAGALGVPTWLLLPSQPNWCWPAECDIAPWYSAVRLIPKPHERHWSSVIHDVSDRLREMTARGRRAA